MQVIIIIIIFLKKNKSAILQKEKYIVQLIRK